jgi:hypothetical protein
MRFKWIIAFFVCFVSLVKLGVAATNDACVLPQGLDARIASKFPDAHIVTLADLYDDHKKLYQKDHDDSLCPGLVMVNFYGDGKPTSALVLFSGKDPLHMRAELLVARKLASGWENSFRRDHRWNTCCLERRSRQIPKRVSRQDH